MRIEPLLLNRIGQQVVINKIEARFSPEMQPSTETRCMDGLSGLITELKFICSTFSAIKIYATFSEQINVSHVLIEKLGRTDK